MDGRSEIETAYHLIWLADASTEVDGERDLAYAELLGSYEDESVAMVWPGIHTGTIQFTWTLHESAPPPDRRGWDDVAEVILALPSGVLTIRGFTSDGTLLHGAPGRYGMRCWARGRDLGRAADPGLSPETFHLDLWLVEQLPPWAAPPELTREQLTERMYLDSISSDQEPVSGELGEQWYMRGALVPEDEDDYLMGGTPDGSGSDEPVGELVGELVGEPEHPALRELYRVARVSGVPVFWQGAQDWARESVMIGVTDAFVDLDGNLMWIGPDHDGVAQPLPPGTGAQTLALMQSQPLG
jgi:hypothetical protein